MSNGLVIVHYNDYESLKDLIENVKKYKCLKKIIIVDNNSKEEIKKKARTLVKNNVEMIENTENKGFSYAINIGVKRCEELGIDNVIISNSDIIIECESDLVELTKYLNKPGIGVVAPTVIEGNLLSRGWKNPTPWLDMLMNIVVIHRIVRKNHIFYKDNYYRNKISYVDVVNGCFFLVKTSTFKEIGYLDENVFLYYEENILAKKIKDIGKKTCVVNDVDIIHNHSVSINKNVDKIKKLKLQKQSQYYFQKNYNKANFIELGLLKFTAFINRNILKLVYLIKK